MKQSRLESSIEVAVNILVGFSINFFFTPLIFPLFGYPVTFVHNFWIGIIFTVISVVRQYAIRRWFNGNIGVYARDALLRRGWLRSAQ